MSSPQTYSNYLFSTCACKKPDAFDYVLPLSQKACLNKFSERANKGKGVWNPKSAIGTFFKQTTNQFQARSVFSGLTGLADEFSGAEDVVKHMRRTVAKVDANSVGRRVCRT